MKYLVGVFVFLAGLYFGYAVAGSSRFQAGQLSACTDMMGLMYQMNPAIEAAQTTCVPYKGGTVAIKVADKYFKLDGTNF